MTYILHDHIVLLLEKEEFESPPAWLTQNFNIIEGGTHTGGSSRNKLIVFKDGTYLELFNWIKQPVEFLDWAQKPPGLIDFALTASSSTSPEENFGSLQRELSRLPSELDLGVNYSPPKAGARKRADGVEVQWKAFRPVFQTTSATPDASLFPAGRIDAPFFCHDVTERNVRVQFDNDEISTHPCGAVGIHSVQVVVPETHLNAYLPLYAGVLRSDAPNHTGNNVSDKSYLYQVDVPHPVDSNPSYIEVRSAKQDDDGKQLTSAEGDDSRFLRERGVGIRGLILKKLPNTTKNDVEVALGEDGIGKTIKVRG